MKNTFTLKAHFDILPFPPLSFSKVYENKLKCLFSHFFEVPQKVSWRLLGLHKTFWGITKKCENERFKLIFSLRSGSGPEGLRNLISCPDVLDMHENDLIRKVDKVDFKIYDITNWEKNNYNTHINQ